ncbi:ATP-grasp domain-containing protein [uncultured Sphaerochaeta sp.]|uniref:D-alanine--D-alanine ligase family protein n=1 Tax=uncultured Sphaerochaeta sp. TaxID=886478 RepID=UPI002A0A11FE|nr:ATP-grasp domain-containing protein [uncultured Sphaerochaeta sp.]
MLVGITYDLKDDYLAKGYAPEKVAEFDNLQTIDAIDESLRSLGYETLRIGNIEALVQFLSKGNRCDLVFNIAEGLHGLGREAQIPALLDAYAIPYVFSETLVLALALHKGMTKAVVEKAGVPTPEYAVLESVRDIAKVSLPFPLFLKPIGGGTGMGISESSIVRDTVSLLQETTRLLKAFGQPVLAERFLEGREYTVGITGTGEQARCVAVMEILVDPKSDQGVYSYKTKQEYLQYAKYRLVSGPVAEECERVALGAWLSLDCRDGGRVDLKEDGQGKVYFLEVNPLAGLNPVDSDLPILCRLSGIDYKTLISRIMDSAMTRMFGETA